MHYSVLVITSDGNYDGALFPYSEHLKVAPYLDKTREDLIAEKKKNLEQAQTEKNKSWKKYLETMFDWTNDNTLLESIKEVDQQEGYTFDEKGNRYTDYNPLSKWDWYAVGGRWSNLLHIKGKKYKVDEAQVKNIDFDAYKLKQKEIDYFTRKWDVIVNGAKPKDKEEYNGLFDSKKALLMDYGTLERYLKVQGSLFTAAMLHHGEWIVPEEDSCISNDTKNIENYENKYFYLLSHLDPNDWVTVIDCHI